MRSLLICYPALTAHVLLGPHCLCVIRPSLVHPALTGPSGPHCLCVIRPSGPHCRRGLSQDETTASRGVGNAVAAAAGIHPLWALGLRGQGQLVGVGDSGLDLDSCWLRDLVGRCRFTITNPS